MAKELKCEVVEKFGVISEKEYSKTNWQTKKKEHIIETKELRRVIWGDNPAKLEIRIWYNTDGVETPGKGITLDDDEIDTLNFILGEVDASKTA